MQSAENSQSSALSMLYQQVFGDDDENPEPVETRLRGAHLYRGWLSVTEQVNHLSKFWLAHYGARVHRIQPLTPKQSFMAGYGMFPASSVTAGRADRRWVFSSAGHRTQNDS